MPLKELLDPQGKAVLNGLANLGLKNIRDVRIGKNISLQVEAGTLEEGRAVRAGRAREVPGSGWAGLDRRVTRASPGRADLHVLALLAELVRARCRHPHRSRAAESATGHEA